MTRPLAILAAAALLAWLWRRRPSSPEPMDEPMDGVQPADPRLWEPLRFGTVSSSPVDWSGVVMNSNVLRYDPTYIEAREVAIRRGGQSSERSLEGT